MITISKIKEWVDQFPDKDTDVKVVMDNWLPTKGEEMRNQALGKEAAMRNFNRVFQLNIRDYFDNILGFDIVKFDEEIVKPMEGESTAEAIERRWGTEAIEIVRALF